MIERFDIGWVGYLVYLILRVDFFFMGNLKLRVIYYFSGFCFGEVVMEVMCRYVRIGGLF